MSISNSSRVSIRGRATLTHVEGNQVNTTTINGNVIHIQEAKAEKDPIYDEFEYVKRSHIIFGRKLGSGTVALSHLSAKRGRGRKAVSSCCQVQTNVFHVKLYPDQQTTLTACIYGGNESDSDAHEAWEEDFHYFARNRKQEKVQLFGFNKWDMPILIFHRELIPLAHILSQSESLWNTIYVACLPSSFSLYHSNMWLDTKSGQICDGPSGPRPGPRPRILPWFPGDKPPSVPNTIAMLNEETCISFYSQKHIHTDLTVDLTILFAAYFLQTEKFLDCVLPEQIINTLHPSTNDNHIHWTPNREHYLKSLWRKFPSYPPLGDIGQLEFYTIYSPKLTPLANVKPLYSHWHPLARLEVKTVKIREMARISLLDRHSLLVMTDRPESLLSQATRIYNAHQPTLYGQDELLVMEPQCIEFSVTARQDFYPATFFNLCDGVIEESPLAYLFVYPPPVKILEYIMWKEGSLRTHFWSFDEDGRSEIPDEECARLDLPTVTMFVTGEIRMVSWPQHVYDSLNRYQIARGFDPNTSDWAKSLGLSEAEIIGGTVNDNGSACIQEVDTEKVPDNLWEAGPGSGISAFGFC